MKMITFRLIRAILASILPVPVLAMNTLSIATFTYSDAPFVYCQGDTFRPDYPGISYELLKHLEQKQLRFEIKRLSKKKAIELLQANKIDAVFPILKNQIPASLGRYPRQEDDQKLIDKNKAISRANYKIYLPAHSPLKWEDNRLINGPDRKLTISTLKHSLLAQKLKRSNSYALLGYDSPEAIFAPVLSGRADGAAVLESMAKIVFAADSFRYRTIQQNGIDLQDKHRFLVFNQALYKHAKPMIESVWKQLEAVNNDTSEQSFMTSLWQKYSKIPKHLTSCSQ